MNLTQELNSLKTCLEKGVEHFNNIEHVFGFKPTTGGGTGIVTMTPRGGTLTPAGRRKISKVQKARWAARKQANPGNGNRIAV